MVIKKCEFPEIEICEDLDETTRNDNGFGSSGD
jgi:dUTPase